MLERITEDVELIKALRCKTNDDNDCTMCACHNTCYGGTLLSIALEALEAAEKRIDGLQKLVDINTERCEALRKQLRESHKSYEKHINELEAQLPKEGKWIVTTEVSDDGAVTSHINCSRCGFYWREPKHGKVFKRCPNCGARMKGEHDEN